MSDPEYDAAIARVHATPGGAILLAEMDRRCAVLCAVLIRESIARERKRWSTGGDVTERDDSTLRL